MINMRKTATRIRLLSCLPLAVLMLAALQSRAQQRTVSSGLILNGVTVVDTHTGALTPDRSIAMLDGKIIRIGPAGSIVARKGASVVDAHGKFVVPGFWNMHAHEFEAGNALDNLTLLLANGITGFRQMSGSDEQLKQRKRGTLVPGDTYPELLAMPGEILTRLNAATPEQAAVEIRKQKAEGADFVKTIDLTPETFFAVAAEATTQGLPFAGHLVRGVDGVKASQAGMRSIEHMGPNETLFLSCSSAEASIRQAMAAHPAPSSIPKNMTPEQFKLIATNPILTRMQFDPQFIAGLPDLLSSYDINKCRQVAKVLLEHGTWLCPTLVRERTSLFGDEAAYESDANLEYVDPDTRQLWAMLGKKFTATATPQSRVALSQFFETFKTMLKLFESAGVGILAGDDSPGIWLVPGFALHQEFDLLAEAGLTPLQVLQSTTLNGAVFLHREGTSGTVEVGKDANLVLLDGNPVESVRNLHKISGVVRAGRYYSRDVLDEMKLNVAKHQAPVHTK